MTHNSQYLGIDPPLNQTPKEGEGFMREREKKEEEEDEQDDEGVPRGNAVFFRPLPFLPLRDEFSSSL